jgi:DNA-binding NtrC family response regulator
MPVLVRRLFQVEEDKESLQEFMTILDDCFNIGSLDFLNLWVEDGSNSPKIKPEWMPLLDMGFHESLKGYEAIYLKYHLENNNWNRNQTASEIGLHKKALNSRLRNLAVLMTKK